MNKSDNIRERLHEYIDLADERHLQAIFVLVENDINISTAYDEATIKELHQRRENHLNESSQSYSAEESIDLIRKKKQ